MRTQGFVVKFDKKRRVVLSVTLSDGTVLPTKSSGCLKATTPEECEAEIRRMIRAREVRSVQGQEIHKARMATAYPMLIFG